MRSFLPASKFRTGLILATALAGEEGLDLSIRRRLVDLADELAHRLAVRRAFPAS